MWDGVQLMSGILLLMVWPLALHTVLPSVVLSDSCPLDYMFQGSAAVLRTSFFFVFFVLFFYEGDGVFHTGRTRQGF